MELVAHANVILAQPLLWHEHGDPGGWWWLWRIGMFLFWIALIGFFFFWWSRRGWWHHQRSGVERARDILAERYALGEISLEEYRERLAHLGEMKGS